MHSVLSPAVLVHRSPRLWLHVLVVAALVFLTSAHPFITYGLGSRAGRNIQPLPCATKHGETGVCMFAWDCMKANGTHLGTCIDRFYFGSCCKLKPGTPKPVHTPMHTNITIVATTTLPPSAAGFPTDPDSANEIDGAGPLVAFGGTTPNSNLMQLINGQLTQDNYGDTFLPEEEVDSGTPVDGAQHEVSGESGSEGATDAGDQDQKQPDVGTAPTGPVSSDNEEQTGELPEKQVIIEQQEELLQTPDGEAEQSLSSGIDDTTKGSSQNEEDAHEGEQLSEADSTAVHPDEALDGHTVGEGQTGTAEGQTVTEEGEIGTGEQYEVIPIKGSTSLGENGEIGGVEQNETASMPESSTSSGLFDPDAATDDVSESENVANDGQDSESTNEEETGSSNDKQTVTATPESQNNVGEQDGDVNMQEELESEVALTSDQSDVQNVNATQSHEEGSLQESNTSHTLADKLSATDQGTSTSNGSQTETNDEKVTQEVGTTLKPEVSDQEQEEYENISAQDGSIVQGNDDFISHMTTDSEQNMAEQQQTTQTFEQTIDQLKQQMISMMASKDNESIPITAPGSSDHETTLETTTDDTEMTAPEEEPDEITPSVTAGGPVQQTEPTNNYEHIGQETYEEAAQQSAAVDDVKEQLDTTSKTETTTEFGIIYETTLDTDPSTAIEGSMKVTTESAQNDIATTQSNSSTDSNAEQDVKPAPVSNAELDAGSKPVSNAEQDVTPTPVSNAELDVGPKPNQDSNSVILPGVEIISKPDEETDKFEVTTIYTTDVHSTHTNIETTHDTQPTDDKITDDQDYGQQAPVTDTKPEDDQDHGQKEPVTDSKPEDGQDHGQQEPVTDTKPEDGQDHGQQEPVTDTKPEDGQDHGQQEPVTDSKPEDGQDHGQQEPVTDTKPEDGQDHGQQEPVTDTKPEDSQDHGQQEPVADIKPDAGDGQQATLPMEAPPTTTQVSVSDQGNTAEDNKEEVSKPVQTGQVVIDIDAPLKNKTKPTDSPNIIFATQEDQLLHRLNTSSFREICGQPVYPSKRIVGGGQASFGEWPWQVSLRQWRSVTYLHKCGAALVNENWAITAAHCVENAQPDQVLLRLGEYDLERSDEPYGYLERKVQIIATHPQFDPRTFEYDLALLRFSEPVTFQPNIIPICIPNDDYSFIGDTGFVSGWGRLYEDGPLPSVMQKVPVPVIPNSECEVMYKNAGYIEDIPNIFICAGYQGGQRDSCEGDSGGPLVIQHNNSWKLAGVISWGIGCALPNQPGVYTRISAFRDWINKIIVF